MSWEGRHLNIGNWEHDIIEHWGLDFLSRLDCRKWLFERDLGDLKIGKHNLGKTSIGSLNLGNFWLGLSDDNFLRGFNLWLGSNLMTQLLTVVKERITNLWLVAHHVLSGVVSSDILHRRLLRQLSIGDSVVQEWVLGNVSNFLLHVRHLEATHLGHAGLVDVVQLSVEHVLNSI